MQDSSVSRRKFIQTTALGTAALGLPTLIPSSAFGANDRLRVAVIGINGRGQDHISGFSKLENVEVATLCDVDNVVLQKSATEFETKYKRKVKTEQDLRRVYEDKDIDAVSIATPNHWHALATIWACQAGKDVYVEKPACHNLFEGRKLVEAANKYNRIVQHGVQLRSSVAIQEAIKHLRDGLIGKVYMARGTVYKWRPDIGNLGNSPVPDGLNWDLWQGPAQTRPFSKNYVHYNWHWFWDYGNGDIGNQGIHETDLCMWGLDVGLPEVITSAGGKFLWNDCKETPEVLTSTYHYPKQGKVIQFEVRPWMTNKEDGVEVGNIFYGDKGYMVINGYADYKTYLGRNREPGPARNAGGDHYKNFVDAVRARDKKLLNGPIETGHLASSLAHLGNISYRLGRTLHFDPQKEVFVNDKEANAMLTRKYRAPYLVPTTV
ncbi:twin-arginine translocation signal domain-containing protein [Rudanella paleaurantiibacter]|uniref:Twin-arginine translocation signal domain-containing protein n=1 Tax=Rudanella paleaurantiibacter TaxID=2614655 RepID=A0A7J5U5P5_9BACT|nr:Gfo/Idh/MocA family oxidoreductase [Rudanella paleaurantiibacter]KAB7733164.1 twin-arginine translocation signal domain-containing protein [Rudanella paleaurantiibacter]